MHGAKSNTHDDASSFPAVVQILDSIGANRGGLTKAVLDRFRLLSIDRKAYLFTVAYQPDVEDVFANLKANGSVPRHVELISYHPSKARIERGDLEPLGMPHETWELGHPYDASVESSGNGVITRYFTQGAFLGLTYRRGNRVLGHVDKHLAGRPWIREFRDSFDSDGLVSRREYFNEDGNARFRIYVGEDGRAYLSSWVNSGGYEYRTVEHTSSGSIVHGDTRAANASWLKEELQKIGAAIVFTDEPRTTFALTVSSQEIRHITSIHSTHYKNNENLDQGLKHWVTQYTEPAQNIEKLVFFTETQRQDFALETRFPQERTAVVSHAAPIEQAQHFADVDRQPQELVTVSRLADDKRVGDAIYAFAKIHHLLPQARYKIFGQGPSLGNLKQLVKKLEVEHAVSFEGHTTEPLRAFSGARASVLTSKFEGFGLVITESFACGTPVLAYDVIYGPRDVINGGNGISVPAGDVDRLADAMYRILTDDNLHAALSQGALSTAGLFTRINWATGWSNLLI